MDLIYFGIGAVGLTAAIVQVIKRIGSPKRFVPALSLVVGLVIVFIGSNFTITPQAIFSGLAVGATACGLYDFGKKTILNK